MTLHYVANCFLYVRQLLGMGCANTVKTQQPVDKSVQKRVVSPKLKETREKSTWNLTAENWQAKVQHPDRQNSQRNAAGWSYQVIF